MCSGENVAALHLDKLSVKATKLSPQLASYLNLPETGTFKLDHHRYRFFLAAQ